MSGGSYDYLFTKSVDDYFISESTKDTLISMAQRLGELGHPKIKEDFFNFVYALEAAQKELEQELSKLTAVMRTVEWYDSYDMSMKDMIEQLNKYYEWKK